MNLRIGLDVDDTISAFMEPYIAKFGNPKNDIEITYNVFNILRHDKNFWMNVPVINFPDFTPTLICSKRCHPKNWSKKYLADKVGIPMEIPFYQLFCQFMSKSKVLKGKVDVYIDDSISNFKEINAAGIPCLLIDSKWNRDFNTSLRIFSLKYAEIEYAYNKNFKLLMVEINTSNIRLNPLLDTLKLQKLEDAIYFSEKYSDYISNSRLGLLQKQGPKAFFEGFGAQIGFNPSFFTGSCVHELVLQPELFELAPDVDKPTAKLGGMADFLYKSYLKNEIVPDEDIIKASNKIDYYRDRMTQDKIDFVRGNCKTYWKNRKDYEANHITTKTIEYCDTKTLETVTGCVNALHNNKYVMDLLHPTDILGNNVISECEQAILLDVEVVVGNEKPFIVRLKSKLDNYTIDTTSNIITVNDVKTTIKDTRQFNDVIQLYSYQREISMYSFLMVLCAKKFYNMENPTVKGNFLVVSTIAPYYTTTVPMTNKLFLEGFQQFKDLLRLACYYKKFGYEE